MAAVGAITNATQSWKISELNEKVERLESDK